MDFYLSDFVNHELQDDRDQDDNATNSGNGPSRGLIQLSRTFCGNVTASSSSSSHFLNGICYIWTSSYLGFYFTIINFDLLRRKMFPSCCKKIFRETDSDDADFLLVFIFFFHLEDLICLFMFAGYRSF